MSFTNTYLDPTDERLVSIGARADSPKWSVVHGPGVY